MRNWGQSKNPGKHSPICDIARGVFTLTLILLLVMLSSCSTVPTGDRDLAGKLIRHGEISLLAHPSKEPGQEPVEFSGDQWFVSKPIVLVIYHRRSYEIQCEPYHSCNSDL